MGDVIWFVGGEDVVQESEGNNNPNQEEFTQEQEDDTEEKDDAGNRGIKLTGAGFIGASRGSPFKNEFFNLDVIGKGSGFC